MQFLRASLLPFALLALVPPTLNAQTFERIDVDSQGLPAHGSDRADISQDGRFVVFISLAPIDGGIDVPGTYDVFVRDRFLRTTMRITTSLDGFNAPSGGQPRISGNGRVIAYMQGNGLPVSPYRAFLHVPAAGSGQEVLLPNLIDVRIVALNQDGTFAVLSARASPSSPFNVYRYHTGSGALLLCSRDANGNPVGGTDGDITSDGSFVSFSSQSSQLVPGDSNGAFDAFVYDIPGNRMLRASVGPNGVEPNNASTAPSLSADGRYVAFMSHATNLILGDSNARPDAFVRDMQLGITTMLSWSSFQTQLPLGAFQVILSADGSGAALSSTHPIHTAEYPSTINCFLRDIEVGVLLPASTGSSVVLQHASPFGITADGREVLLVSSQVDMVGSPSTPGIFVAKFGPRCSSAVYCTSLPSSTGTAASIGAQGDASIALDNLVISAVGLPNATTAMLASGTSAIDPGIPFGNGLLCIGGSLIRHGVHVANGGVILDAQSMQSPEYIGVQPGDTRWYQVVYRDVPAGGAMFNTTDAVAITFCW